MQAWIRRTVKTLAVLASVVVVIILTAAAYVALAWDRPVARSVREMHAPRDAQTVARGAYLYNEAMLCWTCHGSAGGRDRKERQAGGREFDLRQVGPGFGVVWGSNLTSDPGTGVATATDGELVRAIREGIDRRGRVIFPVMAYQFYHGLADEDALALFAVPEHGFSTTAPNLTPDDTMGLGRWTEDSFATAVRTGARPDGTIMLPFMPWPSYGRWSDEDVRAVWLYLRSTTAVSHAVPKSVLTGDAAGPGIRRGAGLFEAYCAACHGDGGRGGSLATIVLRDVVRDADAGTLSTFIVEGGPPGIAMPAFGKTLTREQIDDVVAYLKR